MENTIKPINDINEKLFIILFSTFIVFILFGKTLSAEWKQVDDHEIISFLGKDKKLLVTEIPRIFLSSPDITDFGKTTRFRPSYYLLRIIETAFIGGNVHAWYAFQLILLIIFLSIFWFIILPVTGLYGGAVFITVLLMNTYWADLVSRLGCNEIYAIPGLAIFIYGFVCICRNLYHGVVPKGKYWAFLCIGSVVCGGSKENFLFLLIPTLYCGFLQYYYKKHTLISLLFFCLTITFNLMVMSVIIPPLITIGKDLYGNEVSLNNILLTLSVEYKTYNSMLAISFLILLFLMGLFFYVRNYNKFFKLTIKTATYITGLFILYLTQNIYYHGILPTQTRYDFPAMLFAPIAFLVLYNYVLTIMNIQNRRKSHVNGVIFTILFIFLMYTKGFSVLISKVNQNVDETITYTRHLRNIVSVLQNQPQSPLVLESYSPLDFDALQNYELFLHTYYGLKNPIIVRIHDYDKKDLNLFSNNDRQLIQWNKQFSSGTKGFTSSTEIDRYRGQCYSVFLSGESDTNCLPID
jgi:hypothetical protein